MEHINVLAEFGKYVEPFSSIRTFHEEMNHFLTIGKWNASIFKDRTLLDDMTFSRLTTKKEYKFSKRIIVTVCIARELGVATTERMLALQGHYLSVSPVNKVDLAYRFLLEKGYTDIELCNQVLTSLEIPQSQHLGTISKQ